MLGLKKSSDISPFDEPILGSPWSVAQVKYTYSGSPSSGSGILSLDTYKSIQWPTILHPAVLKFVGPGFVI